MIINGEETKQSIKQYFNGYNHQENNNINDHNVYSTILTIKNQKIKIKIETHGTEFEHWEELSQGLLEATVVVPAADPHRMHHA